MNAQHSELPPSSSNQWIACHGSLYMQRKYPGVEDESAKDGGTAHALGAHKLDSSHPKPPDFTDEMQDAVAIYVDAVRSITQDHKVKVEVRLDIPAVHPSCWGTCDCLWYDSKNDTLHIFDFKYGYGVVEIFDNWQLILYALGALEIYKATNAHLHIIQPRAFHPDGPHRTWKTTSANIFEHAETAAIAAASALSVLTIAPKDGNGILLATGPHCRYCSALFACPAAQRAEGSAIDVQDVTTLFNPTPAYIGFELAVLTRARDIIEHRLSALEQAALEMDKKGTVIPGWEVGFTAGRTVWDLDPARETELETMAAFYGVKVSTRSFITPKQAAKAGLPEEVVTLYSKKNPGKAKLKPINTNKVKQLLGGNVK